MYLYVCNKILQKKNPLKCTLVTKRQTLWRDILWALTVQSVVSIQLLNKEHCPIPEHKACWFFHLSIKFVLFWSHMLYIPFIRRSQLLCICVHNYSVTILRSIHLNRMLIESLHLSKYAIILKIYKLKIDSVWQKFSNIIPNVLKILCAVFPL